MSPLRRLAIALWIAVFVLGGILAANRLLDRPAAVSGELPGSPVPASAGRDTAPERLEDFTLPDLRGTPRSSAEWRGRTVLFNFWATWCAPCRREMPLLEQFASSQAYSADGVAVVGVAIDREEPVLRFVGETGVTYPILVGQMDATRVAESFGDAFRALPFSVIVAPDGSILAIHTGELHAPDLEQIARAAQQLAAGEATPADIRRTLHLGRHEEAAG